MTLRTSRFGHIEQKSSLRNLTTVGGGSATVSVGGYITGGIHSALSTTYGIRTDQIMEMEIVTPGG
jgi:FAD/FMN-containing dehydrogenase